MEEGTYRTGSAEETESLGERFAASLMPGDCVALIGELGGGKTRFVRGLARGLGSRGFVKSPSFTIMNVYEGGRLPLYHMDLYRFVSPEQIETAGLEEFIYGEGVAVIEWADRVPSLARQCRIIIHFRYAGESERQIEVRVKGAGKE